MKREIGGPRSCRLNIPTLAVTNYEQALSYLNATDDMDDAFIHSMYQVQVRSAILLSDLRFTLSKE